jgi:hypothetical protein
MKYEADRTGEPSLAEMTEAAIEYLSNNEEGFYLMVEGGRVDHANHDGNLYRTVTDGVAFAEAVARDEKCAWEFAMVGLGALALGPFVGADGVESVTDGFVLSANAVRGTSPTIGPEYIGRLFVSSSGGGGPVLLLSGGAIGADLGYDAAAAVATIVTVPLPEPGVPLMTGAGVLGLAFLERRRARRRAAALGR